MSTQVIQILLALQNKGTSTYADLEKATDIPLNKLRWAVNDLKQRKLVIQKEYHISNAVAWQISPAGRTHLLEAVHKAERTKETRPTPAPKTPAKAKQSKPRTGRATPAAGGACNSGSSASESLVEAATTSPEGTAVVETRAGGHAPEAAPSADPVVSDEIPAASHNPDSVAFGRWSVDPTEMNLSMDHKGQLTIDNLRFSPDETRLIGQFLIDTEPAWS